MTTSLIKNFFMYRMVLLTSFLLLAIGCTHETPEDVSEDPSPLNSIHVQAEKAARVTLKPTLNLVGVITSIPERIAVISPQIGGWVKKLKVTEGQVIHANDPLVEFDKRSVQTAVKRAKAVVDEKTAVVKRLKSGYLPQEIAGAQQDAQQAAAKVDGLKNELNALKKLLDRREISPVLYNTKSKALKSAEAAQSSADEKVKLLVAGTRSELIDEAEGQLDAAKADLEQMQLNLKWCSISSPIEGVVVQLQARRGKFFDRAVPLATIVDLRKVFVQFRIPSRYFGKVQLGTSIDIKCTSIPDQLFHANITRVSGQADPLTGNVIVFAEIENKNKLLLPGLSCNVKVLLPEIPNTLAIPIAAVADSSGTAVVTVIRDDKAFETEVETGTETDHLVQISKGLSAGDWVATKGGYGLPEGCPVKIVPKLTESKEE